MIIEIKNDKKLDINSFYESIFGEKYISKWGHVKKAIFRWYPQLEEKLDGILDPEIRKKIIYDYVDDIYIKYDSKIQTITQNLKLLFENNKEKIVSGLVTTMDFDPENIPYTMIMPSLKPNSTFWTENISLSVALEVFKNKANPYIDIFVHEITHIIWNQKIWEIYTSVWALWPLAHEDLKEIVAPIIMRDSCFKDIIQSEYMKNANEKQQLLNISRDWVQYPIVDYFESLYKNMREESHTFKEIMEVFVKIFIKIEDQITQKHTIYNEFWFSSKDKELWLKILTEKWYLNPIIL